jgi:hypothetical protein
MNMHEEGEKIVDVTGKENMYKSTEGRVTMIYLTKAGSENEIY